MSDPSNARKGKKDMYSNIALGIVTLSAANTLTFAQLNMAVGMFQGVALLLHRIAYMPSLASWREIVTSADSLTFGLTTSNRITSLADTTDPSIVSWGQCIGVGVAVETQRSPIVEDFSGLPGGGKLIPANPLFLASYSGGFAAAATIRAKIDFTFVELSSADYLELLQSLYPITV